MSILNFVFQEKHIPSKPVGTKVTHSSGKTYIKESTGWYNVQTGNKLDYKSSLILEADSNRNGITFDQKPDGYYMNGMKLTPEQAAPFVNYERMGGNWYNKKNGSAIYREDDRELDQKAAKLLSQLYKEHDEREAAKSSDKEEEKQDDSSSSASDDTSTQENKPEEVKSEADSDKPEAEQGSSEPKPEDQSTEQSDTSSIPNGYVYTSGKGNKFIFKNGTWFNLATKKPVNQSNVNMLNRSAAKMIEDYNSKNEIKIGAKVSSKKGTEYTFNGTGFVSSDGKMLSGGAAQSAMNKLKAQNASNSSGTDSNDATAEPQSDENKPDDTIVPGESALDTQNDDSTPAPQGSSEPSTDSADNAGGSTDYNAQSIIDNLGDHEQGAQGGSDTTSDSDSTTPTGQGSSTNDSSNDPLTKLAQQIKANKFNKQIVTLLSRGSDIDVLAADIILNGNVQDVVNQLKSLNNSNTQ